MKKNKILLFDFDGVIVSSADVSFGINKETLGSLEYDEWQSWFTGNIYQRMHEALGVETVQIEFFEKYKRGLLELAPVVGIKEALRKIELMGYRLIIISSSSKESINEFLDKYGLKKYFIEVLAREVHSSKVEKFKMVFEKYKIKAKETVMVTDTVGDVKEARELKIKSIGTVWGVHTKEQLMKAEVDFVAERPEDILVGVKKILG